MSVATTHFLQDILRQPRELRSALEHLAGPGRPSLASASASLHKSAHVFFTGIGASWHAAIGAAALFSQRGRPVYTQEAGELLYSSKIPKGSVVVALSRTGRSIEIVRLIAKIRESEATLIGITNSADSPLARESVTAIVIPTPLDYAISVNTYSTLALGAAALALFDDEDFVSSCTLLSAALSRVENSIPDWQSEIDSSKWLDTRATYYFLARGASLASCFQARLLWEEGAKMPATAMSTSAFRHGPQEIVAPGIRFCIWVDPHTMREQDLAVGDDLRKLGAEVLFIGQDVPPKPDRQILQIPDLPPSWQFIADVLPIQLAAERLSRLAGVDCDSFRVCSFIVEDEHGLLGKKGQA